MKYLITHSHSLKTSTITYYSAATTLPDRTNPYLHTYFTAGQTLPFELDRKYNNCCSRILILILLFILFYIVIHCVMFFIPFFMLSFLCVHPRLLFITYFNKTDLFVIKSTSFFFLKLSSTRLDST